MVNRCPNCGGLVNYDIEKGQLKCESCDSLFVPEEYDSLTAASENADNEEFDMSIFTCPNCGGSIASNELEAVEYCLYCGSFVTLESQIERVHKPAYILPFEKTKEQCSNSYRAMIRRKLYAPKEFRDEKFLNGFKGIYIPYWIYNYEFGPKVKLDGVKETRHGDYIHEQHFDIDCQADGQVEGISFDATSTFDDEISSRILPFNARKLKPFRSSYMFGFYGDTADIASDVYEEEADELARTKIWDCVSNNSEIKDNNPQKPNTNEQFDKDFGIRKSAQLSMFPVWFLTWAKKGRVAYSVMNGESGDIYSEVPVDIKRYIFFSLIFAIPIFLLLNLFFTFSAKNMLIMAVALSLLMLVLYAFEINKIVRRLLHMDDKGYENVHGQTNDSKQKRSKKRKDSKEFGKAIFKLLKEMGIFGSIGFVFLGSVVFNSFKTVAIGVMSIICILAIVKIIICVIKLKDSSVIVDLLGSIFGLIMGTIMLLSDPAGDEFYYFAGILCIMGVGLSAALAMRRYNELITRPVPHFYEREAGGKF